METGRLRIVTLLIGWSALGLSVLVPLTVSLSSWMQTREMRCASVFSYTFAPLLVTCGERSPAILIFGWTLTAITLGGLALAVVIAIAVAVMAATRFPKGARAGSWVFAATVAAVLFAVCGVLATGPDRGGVNAWILFASAASAFVLVVGGVAGVAVALAPQRDANPRA